ncbi:MAG: AAA family ATPase, partial [Bacteroidota bacterium]
KIASLLAILNKDHTKALKGEGIVLIDEIDLHLHPRWQRRIIPALRKTFPNIQFIVTTHSPQVLSTTTENSILVLSKGTHYSVNSDPKGRDSNGILEEVMGVEKRPKEIERQIENIFTHLSNGSFSESWIADQIKELKLHISQDDPVLLRINNLIKRKRLLAK